MLLRKVKAQGNPIQEIIEGVIEWCWIEFMCKVDLEFALRAVKMLQSVPLCLFYVKHLYMHVLKDWYIRLVYHQL